MKPNIKYGVNTLIVGKLFITDVLDFVDFPLLTVERNITGRLFLNYFHSFVDNQQARFLLEISPERLNLIISHEMTIKYAFDNPENDSVFVGLFDSKSNLNELYLYPGNEFKLINDILEDYDFDLTHYNTLDLNELLIKSHQREKIIIGFYLNAFNLTSSLKFWALKNFLLPLSEMIYLNLGINFKKTDDKLKLNDLNLGYSRLDLNSLRGDIEINYTPNLFNEDVQLQKLTKIFQLLNSSSKDELTNCLMDIDNKRILSKYISVLNAISKNDAKLEAGLVSPRNDFKFYSVLDKSKSYQIRKILNEQFPAIEDIEEIEGQFLEMDFSIQHPTFTIQPLDEDDKIHGRISEELASKISDREINFKGKEYTFTVKTVFLQQTSKAPEKTNRILIDFKEI